MKKKCDSSLKTVHSSVLAQCSWNVRMWYITYWKSHLCIMSSFTFFVYYIYIYTYLTYFFFLLLTYLVISWNVNEGLKLDYGWNMFFPTSFWPLFRLSLHLITMIPVFVLSIADALLTHHCVVDNPLWLTEGSLTAHDLPCKAPQKM